jgi:hypothetical protein
MDYQELADTAVKSAARTKKLDLLAGSGLDNDTKELIANLGEIKDGEVKIKVPGTEELIDAKLLGNEENKGILEKLEKQQEDASKSDREIALEQLAASEKLNKVLDAQIKALGPFIGTSTDAIKSAIDAAGAAGQTLTSSVSQGINSENINELGGALDESAKTGFKNEDNQEVLRSRLGDVLDSLNTEIKNFDVNLKNNIDDDSLFKTSEAFDNLGGSLKKFGLDIETLKSSTVSNVLGGITGDLDSFITNLIALKERYGQRDEQRPDNQEGTAPSTNTIQTVTPVTPVTPNTNIQDTSNLNQTTTQGVLNGDVNLNVGGTIDFAIDGRNLPQNISTENISTEELASQIVNNPDFTSKLMSIFTDSNNTYSV